MKRVRRSAVMRRHATLMAAWLGEGKGCREFRKHVSWYLKGFAAGGELRRALAMISSLTDLDELLVRLDPTEPFPVSELGAPRGRQGSPRDRVALPEHWLDDTDGTGCGLTEDTSDPRRVSSGSTVITRIGFHTSRRRGGYGPTSCACQDWLPPLPVVES